VGKLELGGFHVGLRQNKGFSSSPVAVRTVDGGGGMRRERERDELRRGSGSCAQGGGRRPARFDKNTPPFSPFFYIFVSGCLGIGTASLVRAPNSKFNN